MEVIVSSKQQQPLVFAYYVTGHGFGHATRVVEVARHLILEGHIVHVVTAAPDFVYTSVIQSPRLFLRKELLDCGAVQCDALTVDRIASLEKYSETAVIPRETILATEVKWLRSIKADLVVSDVVPVACRAAADAGIRSVCCTNFRWFLNNYFNINGVFKTNFPDKPPAPFNYTGVPLTASLGTVHGTRLSKIAFNSTVELVLQDTNLLTVESHPFHLHGYNFFVVGTGIGNFDPAKDPAKYNLVDPVERNTVGVPTGGWTAIRFRADNPGVWFMHCHLELHTGWGLKTAFVVEEGPGSDQSILPPPKDLPPC